MRGWRGGKRVGGIASVMVGEGMGDAGIGDEGMGMLGWERVGAFGGRQVATAREHRLRRPDGCLLAD